MQHSHRAQDFVTKVTDEFELDDDEQILLSEVAGAITTIDLLSASLEGESPIVKGSTGQPRLHPAIEEVRAQRALLARLLKQLGLSDMADDEAQVTGNVVRPHRWDSDSARAAGRASGRSRRG